MLATVSDTNLTTPMGYTNLDHTNNIDADSSNESETDENMSDNEEITDEPVEFNLLHTRRCRPQSSILITIQFDPDKVKPGTEFEFEPDLETLSKLGLVAPNAIIMADESSQATIVIDNPDPWNKVKLDKNTVLGKTIPCEIKNDHVKLITKINELTPKQKT